MSHFKIAHQKPSPHLHVTQQMCIMCFEQPSTDHTRENASNFYPDILSNKCHITSVKLCNEKHAKIKEW